VPVIEATVGKGFIVTERTTKDEHPNPLVTLYVIIVVPADTPVTTPVALTVAIDVLNADHTPPVVALERVTESKRHNEAVPVIADIVGNGLTVTSVYTCVLQPNAVVTL
jgi:hypothetical protein